MFVTFTFDLPIIFKDILSVCPDIERRNNSIKKSNGIMYNKTITLKKYNIHDLTTNAEL